MARSVEKITKELTALEQSSKTLADEFYQIFLNYLNSLGKAVKTQLILASYYLCTQGYPEAFIGLSLKEKQEMQSAIRQVANVAVQELSILLPLSLKVEQNSQNTERETIKKTIKKLSDATDEIIENLFDEMDEIGATDETDETGETDRTDETDILIESEDLNNPLASAVLTNPLQIDRWHQKLEKGILEVLQTISRMTNIQLQKYHVLPKKLPLPDILLEAAAKASSYGEPVGNQPNLLNLTIELPKPEESQKSKNLEEREIKIKDAINILSIYLRLSDIEFADPVVMAGRNQIRQFSHRLNGLKREYQKKQQERTIAEAEAAWRSSWFEE